MVGQRGDLTRRAAAGDDQVVGDFRLAGEVDRHDALGLAVFKAREDRGQERRRQALGRLGLAAPTRGKSRDRGRLLWGNFLWLSRSAHPLLANFGRRTWIEPRMEERPGRR